ncbi:hypothetical protein BJX62DRAFT_203209 [Aspergillus germanicus]
MVSLCPRQNFFTYMPYAAANNLLAASNLLVLSYFALKESKIRGPCPLLTDLTVSKWSSTCRTKSSASIKRPCFSLFSFGFPLVRTVVSSDEVVVLFA